MGTTHTSITNKQLEQAIEQEACIYFKSNQNSLLSLPKGMLSPAFMQRLPRIHKKFISIHDHKLIIYCGYSTATLTLACNLVLHEATLNLIGEANTSVVPADDIEQYFRENGTNALKNAQELLHAARFFGISQRCFVALMRQCQQICNCTPRELFYPKEIFYKEVFEENIKSLAEVANQQNTVIEEYFDPQDRRPSNQEFVQTKRRSGLKNDLYRQLDLTPRDRRGYAFGMAFKHADQDPSTTFPYVIDKKSWQDLEILCGSKAHPSSYFATAIDRTSSEIGKVLLYSTFLQPNIDLSQLAKKQAALKLLADPKNQDTFQNLDSLFKDFFGNKDKIAGLKKELVKLKQLARDENSRDENSKELITKTKAELKSEQKKSRHEDNILSFFQTQDCFGDLLRPNYSKDDILLLQKWARYSNTNEFWLGFKENMQTLSLNAHDKITTYSRDAKGFFVKTLKRVPIIEDNIGWLASITNYVIQKLIVPQTNEAVKSGVGKLSRKLPLPQTNTILTSITSVDALKKAIALILTPATLKILLKSEPTHWATMIAIGVFQNLVTSIVINIINGTVSNSGEMAKHLLEINFCLQKRLVLLANYVHFIKAVDEQINKLPAELKEYIPALSNLNFGQHKQDFLGFLWNEFTHPASFEQFLEKLCSKTFSESGNWSHTGRVISTYRLLDTHKEALFPAIMAIAELDTYLSVVRLYKESTPGHSYCFPTYNPTGSPSINFKELWNPAIGAKSVSNSVALGVDNKPKDMIVTGPNTGGKSTFLRSLLFGTLMGQSLGILPAKEGSCFTPFASMRTYINIVDDPADNASLFKAHLDRGTALTASARKQQHSLTVFDELYNGTKPEFGESLAYGNLKYLNRLAHCPQNLCIGSTHFSCIDKLARERTGTAAGTNFRYYKVGDIYSTDRYKMIPGIYRGSVAFQIARDSNMPAEIIDFAQSYHQEHFANEKNILASEQYLNSLERSPVIFLQFMQLAQADEQWFNSYQALLLNPVTLARLLAIARKHNINPAQLLNITDTEKRTVLHIAALLYSEDTLVLTTLIKYGANPMLQDMYGNTALDYAQQDTPVSKLLLTFRQDN